MTASGYAGVLIDMDGILQVCGAPVPGASEFISHLKYEQIPFVVLTNECRYTNQELSTALGTMGVPVSPRRIYTAANSCADFLSSWTREEKLRVFVVGESGLMRTLAEVAELVDTPDADYVVIGSYFKDVVSRVETAVAAVRGGARLLYTCPDSFEVDAQGKLRLGMPLPHVELICKITGVTAFNTGKPNANMARSARRLLGLGSEAKVLMVGDSLDTDIRLATENGIDSVLVLSAGDTSREKLSRSCLRPNFIFKSVLDFSQDLPRLLRG
jgi:HAD superfamily hydrolase (TIGR01450 family)